MLETITLDSRTLVIKTDNEGDLTEIIDILNKKDKINDINSFLRFAARNRIMKENYKFNREDCYGR